MGFRAAEYPVVVRTVCTENSLFPNAVSPSRHAVSGSWDPSRSGLRLLQGGPSQTVGWWIRSVLGCFIWPVFKSQERWHSTLDYWLFFRNKLCPCPLSFLTAGRSWSRADGLCPFPFTLLGFAACLVPLVKWFSHAWTPCSSSVVKLINFWSQLVL